MLSFELLQSIEQIDKSLIALLETNTNILSDGDLNEIQGLIQQRKKLLNEIETTNIDEHILKQDKAWQELAHRTYNLVELATQRKDDIKEKIDRRGRGKRSVVAYNSNI